MQLSGKKIALLVDNIYQEMEVWYPLYRLREAGAQVVTVGAKAGETNASKLGYPVHCDKSYDQVSASQFDGVVVPGGYAPDHIRRHDKANQLVHDFDAQGNLFFTRCFLSLPNPVERVLQERQLVGPAREQIELIGLARVLPWCEPCEIVEKFLDEGLIDLAAADAGGSLDRLPALFTGHPRDQKHTDANRLGEALYQPFLVFLGATAAVVLLLAAGIVLLNLQLGIASAVTLATAPGERPVRGSTMWCSPSPTALTRA